MIGKIQHKRRLDADGEWQDVKTFIVDGREVDEAAFNKAFPPQPLTGGTFGGTPLTGWPILSEALAIDPSLIAEGRRDAQAKGVPTDFTADGRVILRDRKHRADYQRAYGYFDKDAGYGDAQRGTRR